jgi:DNA-binding NarL/FixJ family response regulator
MNTQRTQTAGITENKTVRVVLVDDHEIVRVGLRALFSREAGIEVVGEANSAATALLEVERLKPDVVILDVRMPNSSGFEVCREIHRLKLGTRVLFLTSFGDDDVIFKAINAGADGFMLKETDVAEVVKAVKKVAAGKSVLDEEVTQRILGRIKSGTDMNPAIQLEQLSAQERRVVALVAEGKTNKEIAVVLELSDKTVKNYLGNAMEKLQMSRRSQVAAFVAQHSGD